MNAKLDHLFRFRDNEKFKKFLKYYTYVVLAYAFAVLVLVCVFKKTELNKGWAFSVIPLLLTVSFFRKNDYLFILAELITVIADIFLMLIGDRHIGFPVYLFVQLTYAAYFFFRDSNRKRQFIMIGIRVLAMILGVVLLYILGNKHKLFDVTYAFGVMYFMNLLINVVCACFIKDPVLIVGFAIFALSDSCIFLETIANKLKIEAIRKIYAAFNIVHFTYLISQAVLIFNNHRNIYSKELLHK